MRLQQTWRQGIVGLVLAILLATLLPLPAKAADDGFNLTISPLPLSLSTNPGQAITTPVRVQNTGNKAVRLKVSLMKFAANGTGTPDLQTPSPNDAFIKWVSFSKTSFIAQPNVFNSVEVTIKPPASAAFGYYYAVVFSQDNGNQPLVASQNRVNGAVASLILLNVNAPGEKRQLSVTSFKSQQKVYQYLPAKFDITVKNTGNIHTVPTGNLFISRPGSKDFISTLSINQNQGNVLPKSSRTYTVEWDDGFPSYQSKRQNGQVVSDSSGQPIKQLSWSLANVNKFRIGHYTASMTLVYNDGQKDVPINGSVSFWVIPWVPFLIIIVVLLLVGFGLYTLLRSLLQKAKKIRKK